MGVHLLGELTVEIAGKSVTLVPTNKSLVLMEQLTGKSLSELVQNFLRVHTSFADAAAILRAGMYGANGNKLDGVPSLDECADMVMQKGLANITPALSQFVSSAYVGKPIDELTKLREAKKAGPEKQDAEGNAKAGTEVASPS